MAIRSRNLNLIPILQALLQEESVVRAADKVGLSQPAMSGALARLREVMADPILVRVGRTMRLTPRAERMRGKLEEVCAQIELLFEPEIFDPASATRVFYIAAPDYLAYIISQALMPFLAEHAPGIRVVFTEVQFDLDREMREGNVDLAVCANFGHWPELSHEFLFKDRIVVAVANQHPLASRASATTADIFQYPSISYFYDTAHIHLREAEFHPTGLTSLDHSTSIIASDQFTSVLATLRPPTVSRCNAALVERLIAVLPLTMLEIEDEMTEFDTVMFWPAQTEGSLEHEWLRSAIRQCLTKQQETA